MDLSEGIRSFPSHVSLIALKGSDETDLEIFAEEMRFLPARTTPLRAAEFRLGRRAAHRAHRRDWASTPANLARPHRDPLWPAGVVGSITHAGESAVAAVAFRSDAGGIGIDLKARDRYFSELETEIAGEEELVAVRQMEPPARKDATIETSAPKNRSTRPTIRGSGAFSGSKRPGSSLVVEA